MMKYGMCKGLEGERVRVKRVRHERMKGEILVMDGWLEEHNDGPVSAVGEPSLKVVTTCFRGCYVKTSHVKMTTNELGLCYRRQQQ